MRPRKHNANIGVLIWDVFLKKVILFYFDVSAVFNVIYFPTTGFSQDFISDSNRLDILIAEAFNPFSRQDPAGFRPVLELIEGGFTFKPLIIFRSLDNKYKQYPFFIDFSTINLLPEKINELLKIKKIDLDLFRDLAKSNPLLTAKPVHKNVV